MDVELFTSRPKPKKKPYRSIRLAMRHPVEIMSNAIAPLLFLLMPVDHPHQYECQNTTDGPNHHQHCEVELELAHNVTHVIRCSFDIVDVIKRAHVQIEIALR